MHKNGCMIIKTNNPQDTLFTVGVTCVQVNMYMCVCVYMCTYVHMEARGQPWMSHSGRFSTIFLTEFFTGPGASCEVRLVDGEPQGLDVSTRPVLGSPVPMTMPGLFCGFWERKSGPQACALYQPNWLLWPERMLLLLFPLFLCTWA